MTITYTTPILRNLTCPHCWTTIKPEEMLFVSEHIDLLGDSKLGSDQPIRFRPTRFTVQGEAIDAKGFPCLRLACPNCHLQIPRASLEMPAHFLSIFGAPGSGKSYYLASMTWEMRRRVGEEFRLAFNDADPEMNQHLNEYEEALFVNSRGAESIPLGDLIRKTETQGDLYASVNFGNQNVIYARPFLFTLQPRNDHPQAKQAENLARVICLYDNAGESFQPGADTAANPVTRHLARSRALMFVFDPLQDVRFRQAASLMDKPRVLSRQEPVLQEAASRVRRYAGLSSRGQHDRPLIVVLTKADQWIEPILGGFPEGEPLRTVVHNERRMNGIDLNAIEQFSAKVREQLLKISPEIIAAAESFCKEVIYIPTSAVGSHVVVDPETGLDRIRPAETAPQWVTVPMFYALARTTKGLVPIVGPRRRSL